MTAWIEEAKAAGGVFVTGTDTGIGKTVVSALLVRVLGATYWKPLQTGVADGDDDSRDVAHLAGVSADRVLDPAYRLAAPLSPEMAATPENVTIDKDRLERPTFDGPLVIEGAGGVLVPVTTDVLMADLAKTYALPTVIVARTGLGTINHTLLTLEALRARAIPILGVIMSGEPNDGNRAAIERHGAVPVFLTVPLLSPLTPERLQAFADRMKA